MKSAEVLLDELERICPHYGDAADVVSELRQLVTGEGDPMVRVAATASVRCLVAEQERDALAAPLRAQVALLSQVALEAIRLVHGSVLGDHYSHEPCSECGLGGEGALRDALTKALGAGYTTLVWGNDMNIDGEAWTKALESAGKAKP